MRKISLCLIVLCLLSAIPVLADNGLSKYNFVPGEKTIVYEDLSTARVGDIPVGTLKISGPAEVVQSGNQRWLNVGDCFIDLIVPKDVKDLTLEFYLKQNETDGAFRLFLENEAQDYASFIDVGAANVYYEGHYQGEQLPSGGAEKDFYASNQTVQIALTIQNRRTQLYVNKNLAMNTNGFNPVMPAKLRIGFLRDGSLMAKDFTLATQIPDIAGELLTLGKYTSHGVRFDTGASQVKEESYSVLKQVAAVLAENPDLQVMIVGHTDNTGAAAGNQKLSVARAESVKQFLISRFAIPTGRLQTAGKGDSQPIADNKTADGKAKNRRVEFIRIK